MAYSAEVLADTPLAYYRMGETGATLVDSSGNNRDGVYGGSTPTPTTGLLTEDPDGARDFAGGWGYVARAAWMDVPNALTVEAWVNADTFNADRIIASRTNWQQGPTGSERGWALIGYNGRWHIGLTFTDNSVHDAMVGPAPAVGTTYHVVLTWDGNVARLYTNAEEIWNSGSAFVGKTLRNPPNSGLGIAREQVFPGSVGLWDGRIDEVAVYDTALSPARIAAHHAAGTTSTPPAPVTIEVPGTLSGTGTLTGTAVVVPPPGAEVIAASGALTGSGTLTAQLTQIGPVAVTGNLSGTGSLTAMIGGGIHVQAGLSSEGTLSATEDSGRVIFFSLIVAVLDDVLDQAPTSVAIVVLEGWPLQEVEVRIDGVVVDQVTLDQDGELGPTSIDVPSHLLAGEHTLSVVPVTEAGVSDGGSTTFTLEQDPAPSPYPIPLDAAPVYIEQARLSTGVHRWVLQDLMPGGLGSWIFERNPISAAPLPIGRDLNQEHTVSVDGQFHITDPVGRVSPWSFAGAYFTRAFQDQLLSYANLNRRLYLIDHRNRAWTIAIVGVDLVPRRRVRSFDGRDNDEAGEYTVRCLLFSDQWKEPQ